MSLRHWQSACIKTALDHYLYHRHFFCLATPGAGKTTMAAHLARALLASGQIDFVLCFSPSVSVAEGFRQAFGKTLGRRFDGLIGAVGCSYTYQALLHFDAGFWEIFDNHRVMVVFDEIHHCAGTTGDDANGWGEEILFNIQDRAHVTLAMSGTPWRSDRAPIVLSRYSDPEGQIQCDFRYGLVEAVRDGVCRRPHIVLIDNEAISIRDGSEEIRTYSSFTELLQSDKFPYHALISHEDAIRFMLARGCDRLAQIRRENPYAGGLVVAASVAHAKRIADMLTDTFAQSVMLVSYQNPDAAELIRRFRESTTQWIVSIGMVSEGTDIPRLQVCCHLSPIKTELHYRQVLGRILRVTGAVNQDAWLLTFAEPNLSDFAHRVGEDLPGEAVVSIERVHGGQAVLGELSANFGDITRFGAEHETEEYESDAIAPVDLTLDAGTSTSRPLATLLHMGHFREQVIATFNSPF
ncbi:DEAD/DEAH box helicase [Chitinimonas sp.]|uniref:DEAD/DEAH box helicase n=1 Tax=Chitinimonas sp. TaxID=1934313 RepID=UPI0035B3BD40